MALVIKKTAHAVVSTVLKDNNTGNEVENTSPVVVALPPGLQGEKSLMQVPSPDVTNPNCEVGFDASYTHNLGNYSSVKVGVSLKIDCAHSEIDEVYDYATEWVNGKMAALREELDGGAA